MSDAVSGGAGAFREGVRDVFSIYPPAGAVIGVARAYEGKDKNTAAQPGPGGRPQENQYSFGKSWDDSTRRQETAIRGPPPKTSVSMVKYIAIAVIIIAVLLIYYGIGRKWNEPPKYQSVFDNFTPDRMVIPQPRDPVHEVASDSGRAFGIMPRQSIVL